MTEIQPQASEIVKKREQRKWWTIDGNTVRRVTGYSCKPANPESWWCPEVGYTLNEEHHLYETELQAIDACILETRLSIAEQSNALDKLSARRKRL